MARYANPLQTLWENWHKSYAEAVLIKQYRNREPEMESREERARDVFYLDAAFMKQQRKWEEAEGIVDLPWSYNGFRKMVVEVDENLAANIKQLHFVVNPVIQVEGKYEQLSFTRAHASLW